MESYALSWELDHWTLRKLPENSRVRAFTDKAQALHESLSYVHPLGATLVLSPNTPSGFRRRYSG